MVEGILFEQVEDSRQDWKVKYLPPAFSFSPSQALNKLIQ